MNMGPSCDRCGQLTLTTTMSKFNTDKICMECKDDEKLAPGYEFADKMETDAVRNGQFNFPGVGLSPADRVFLSERVKARAK